MLTDREITAAFDAYCAAAIKKPAFRIAGMPCYVDASVPNPPGFFVFNLKDFQLAVEPLRSGLQALSPEFTPESMSTGRERSGQGGIPAASPSAPRLERLAVPTLLDPCGIHPDSVESDRDPSNVARLGQATLTTG